VDTFTYTLTDPSGTQSTALVVIDVSASGPELPIAPPILGPGSGQNDNPAPRLEGGGPTDPSEDTAQSIAVDDAATPAEAVVSDDPPLNGTPQLALSGSSGGPTDFIESMTLSEDSDSYRQRGPAGKFLYDTMQILRDVLEFEEFEELGLRNVNVDHELLWQALDTIKRQINGLDNPDDVRSAFVLQIATGSGVVLTAGYVAWILRGGALASMLLSTMPIWKGFDPLPLLVARRKKRKKKEAEEARQRVEADAADNDATQEVEGLFAVEQTDAKQKLSPRMRLI
jgi:hypothetical protein